MSSMGTFHMWQKKFCPYLLRVLHRASYTVESLWNSFPVLSHFHHGTCIEDSITKEVIKFQANPIPSPLMNLIVKLVPLGGEHSQMLHVSPGQIHAGYGRQREQSKDKSEGGRHT